MKLSFVQKLVLSYSTILVVLLVTLFTTAYAYILNVTAQNAAVSQGQLLEKTIDQVELYFDEMLGAAERLRTDSRLVSTFSALAAAPEGGNSFERNIMEAIDVQSSIVSMMGPASGIWRINIYNQYGDFISTDSGAGQNGNLAELLAPTRVEALLDEVAASPEGYLLIAPYTDTTLGASGVEYITMVGPLTNYYGTEVYGVVEIQQTLDRLEGYLYSDDTAGMVAFLFDADGGQIYPKDTGYAALESDSAYFVQRAATAYGYEVALAQSRDVYMAPYANVILFLVVAGVAIMVFLFIMIYLITRSVSKPLVGLTEQVRAVTIERIPETLQPESGNDEIKELTTAFASMMQKLNDSISLERRAYLLALQSQMDPHFLYNSLSTISSMAIEKGDDNIALFCDKLGAMLRYSTSYDNRDITLAQELENGRNYLDLMKLRYEELFVYTVDVEERLLCLPMPRLVLQPILENCFAHGFKNAAPVWEIHLKAWATPGRWHLSVKDNGSGMSAEARRATLDKVEEFSKDIQANYHEMKMGGMGLVNTIIRLDLASEGGIHCALRNNSPKGTEVLLEGEFDDTGIDR